MFTKIISTGQGLNIMYIGNQCKLPPKSAEYMYYEQYLYNGDVGARIIVAVDTSQWIA